MNTLEEIIRALEKDAVIPDIVMQKSGEAFETIKKEEHTAAGKKVHFRKRAVFFLAAALLLLAVSAGAEAYLRWSRSLQQGLRVEEGQMKTLEEEHAVTVIGQSASDSGITVTAQQSIVDNYYAYISFKVEGFELTEGQQPGFGAVNITVNGISSNSMDDMEEENRFKTGGGFYSGVLMNENGVGVYEDGSPLETDENGQVLYHWTDSEGNLEYRMLLSNARNAGFFTDVPITVEFQNLGILDKAQFYPLTEGSWNFDFTLQGTSQVCKFDGEYVLGDRDIKVVKAEVSPISLKVFFQGSEKAMKAFGTPKFAGELTGVRLKDGTMLPFIGMGGDSFGFPDEEGGLYWQAFPVDRVLDIREVDGLLLRKSYPKDGITWTEDQFFLVPLTE